MKMTLPISALLSFMPLAFVCGQSNTVGTISYDPALYSDGYTLIYPHNQPHALLIDACGDFYQSLEGLAEFGGPTIVCHPMVSIFRHRMGSRGLHHVLVL